MNISSAHKVLLKTFFQFYFLHIVYIGMLELWLNQLCFTREKKTRKCVIGQSRSKRKTDWSWVFYSIRILVRIFFVEFYWILLVLSVRLHFNEFIQFIEVSKVNIVLAHNFENSVIENRFRNHFVLLPFSLVNAWEWCCWCIKFQIT